MSAAPTVPPRSVRYTNVAPWEVHWTPAEIAAEEAALAEQAEHMQRKADNDAEALDPDDEPAQGPEHG